MPSCPINSIDCPRECSNLNLRVETLLWTFLHMTGCRLMAPSRCSLLCLLKCCRYHLQYAKLNELYSVDACGNRHVDLQQPDPKWVSHVGLWQREQYGGLGCSRREATQDCEGSRASSCGPPLHRLSESIIALQEIMKVVEVDRWCICSRCKSQACLVIHIACTMLVSLESVCEPSVPYHVKPPEPRSTHPAPLLMRHTHPGTVGEN